MSIFKACDVRGVVGTEWSAPDAYRIGQSLGGMLTRRGEGRICVGGDFRRTTPALKQALIRGLLDSPIEVVDFGQLPTPAVYFGARHLGCGNVAIITASHNAGRYNGVKFTVAGRPAIPELVEELRAGTDASRPASGQGIVSPRNVEPDYERWISEQAHELVAEAWTARGEVRDGAPSQAAVERPSSCLVLDTMGGAFTEIAPRVLRSAGWRVECLHAALDHDFLTTAPNPASDRNLQDLVDRVRSLPSDGGLALDGDGDRVIFVDGTGRIVRPEQIAAVLVQRLFGQLCDRPAGRPTVVYDLKCASLAPRVVRELGGTAIMRPSGHGFIKSAMIDERADLGVEVSGHHFFVTLDGGDDGLFTALVILEILRRTGQTLQQLIEPLRWPLITPDLRVPFTGDASALIERIAATCGGCVSRLDGVRVEYDRGWGLARASITEPAVTFRFEGSDANQLRNAAVAMLAAADEVRETVMELIDEWLARTVD